MARPGYGAPGATACRHTFIICTYSLTRPTIKPVPLGRLIRDLPEREPVLGRSVAKKETVGQDVVTEDHSDALSRRAR